MSEDRRELHPETTGKPGYQDRVVLFLDILGFKEITARTVLDQQYFTDIVRSIKDIRNEFLPEYKSEIARWAEHAAWDPVTCPDYQTAVTQFSDSMIISNLAAPPGAVQELVADTAFAIHVLISRGLLCRGSIQRGRLYHTDDYIMGPAYIAAYLGERESVVPAVSLSQEVYEYALKNPARDWRVGEHFERFVLPLAPRKYYIDYFNDLEGFIDMRESPEKHYARLREAIQREYGKAKEDSVRVRYIWMIDRFNSSSVVRSGHLSTIQK